MNIIVQQEFKPATMLWSSLLTITIPEKINIPLYSHNEGWRTTLLYKNIALFILLGVQNFCTVWETDGDRDRLLYWPITFSWPYHAVLSSRPHLALLLLGWGYSTGGPMGCCGPLPPAGRSQWLQAGSDSDPNWLQLTPTDKPASAYIIS